MAYKKGINSECNESTCGSDASYRVFNDKNASAGEFCKRHADKRVRDLKRTEAAVINSMTSIKAKKVSRDKLRRRGRI